MMKRFLILALLLFLPTLAEAQRINKHGGLVDVDSTGAVIVTPFTGRGTTATGKFNACIDAGSNDTYACSLTPALGSYVTGQVVWFKAATANTGAATVNFNALGAKTIKKVAGGVTTDLATNDIRAGQWVSLVYDGTNMQMLSLLGNAPDVAASILAASISDSDTTHAPDGNSVFDALALKQNLLTNPLVGAGASYKLARGVASITGSGDVVTGLASVVSIVVTPVSDLDGTTLAGCSATIGNQSGAPAAGSVTIKCWKITTADNGALIAADAAKSVNWIAIGL
jgi:hypothetical protein